MPHFTYIEPNQSQLKQGDILKKTDEIKAILSDVHPHYLKDDYKYFLILTQSCDLERRGGNTCKSHYITLAAVRPLELLIEREIKKYQKNNTEKGKLLDKSNRSLLYNFIEKLLNNNDSNHFYLNEDSGMGFPESCVAFLRLSIAIKAPLHYDNCLSAKILELRDDFKAKLGWLVGNIYSRVGTEDWTNSLAESDFKKKINGILEQYCFWIDTKGFIKELKKMHPPEEIHNMDEEALIKIYCELKIPSRKEKVLGRVREILSEKGYVSEEKTLNEIILIINNDTEITALLK